MADRSNGGDEERNVDQPLNGSEQASMHDQPFDAAGSDAVDETRLDDTGFDDTEFDDDPGAGLDNLSAMQGDDALLDALGGLDPSSDDSVNDAELNDLLLAWRRDIDSEPMIELVDTDTAVTTIKTAAAARRHRSVGRKRRALVPVAVAAAVLAIAFTGTGLAARNAAPGDPLWGLTQVLYTDHAQSVQAAASVRLDLDTADTAIDHGRLEKARQALDAAADALTKVAPEDNLEQLRAEHRVLSRQLDGPEDNSGSTPGTSIPGQSSAGTSASTPPDSSSSSEPSDSQIPPEQTSPSEEPTSPTTTSTTTTSPSPSSSDSGGDSGTAPKVEIPNKQTQGAPAS